MNSDRLISKPAALIAAGLNTKWTNYCPFMGVTWSSSSTDNGVMFNTLTTNQVATDIAHFLEPEDLWYILLQNKSEILYASKDSLSIPMNDNNIKAIIAYKWNRNISQLPNTSLMDIIVNGDNLIFQFMTIVLNESLKPEKESLKSDIILTGYLDGYFTKQSSNISYPNITHTYLMDWDKIRARFNYRMETSL